MRKKSEATITAHKFDSSANSESSLQPIASDEPDFYVYIDESQKGEAFSLSAVFVPREKLTPMREAWNALRRRIKVVLLENYSLASEHPDLQGDGLPEIHAVDMFHSDSYYRKHKRGTNLGDKYWEQHYEWMEDALRIIAQYKLRFTSETFPTSEREKYTQTARESFMQLFTWIDKSQRVKKKNFDVESFYALTGSDYFYAMPDFLLGIEAYLRWSGKTGEIICDEQTTYNLSAKFSNSDAISWLQLHDVYKHVTAPRFSRSLDEIGLQACDLLSFISVNFLEIAVSHLVTHKPLTQMKQPLGKWFAKYVVPLHTSTEERGASHHPRAGFLISTDMLIDFCVLDEYVKTVMKQIARRHTPLPWKPTDSE